MIGYVPVEGVSLTSLVFPIGSLTAPTKSIATSKIVIHHIRLPDSSRNNTATRKLRSAAILPEI